VRSTLPAACEGVEIIHHPRAEWPSSRRAIGLTASGGTDAVAILERDSSVADHVNTIVHELVHVAQHRWGEVASEAEAYRLGDLVEWLYRHEA
jgi:hypothetical protein